MIVTVEGDNEGNVKVGRRRTAWRDDLNRWTIGGLPEVHSYALMHYDDRCHGSFGAMTKKKIQIIITNPASARGVGDMAVGVVPSISSLISRRS